MENNSTGNGDKRSWRDRLGIGTKELPRIAEEFKSAPPPVKPPVLSSAGATAPKPPAPGSAKPAPRAAQAVAKPAPMAPRPAAAKPPRIEPVLPADKPAVDAFSERLRAQREAAEKMAEQRVMAARQKAEEAAAQRNKAAAPAKPVDTQMASDSGRPKFSFVEEDPSVAPPPTMPKRAQAQVSASIAPPRPAGVRPVSPSIAVPPPRVALGAERPPLPPRPAQPSSAAPVTNQFPLGEGVGGYTPPPPVFPPRPSQAPAPIDSRTSTLDRPPYYETSALPPLPEDSSERGYTGAPPPVSDPRMARPQKRGPMAGPIPGAVGAMPGGTSPGTSPFGNDDIFERPSAARSQRRVTAGDYQNAYRDTEMGYGYEAPRSNAPWVLLLLIALTAILSALGVWYYQTHVKFPSIATTQESPPSTPLATTQPTVPVVNAPDTQVKAVPEATAPSQPVDQNSGTQSTLNGESNSQSVVPATTKKEIYDRIVGDREVLGGQIVPTEEQPVAPGGTPGQDQSGAAAPPATDPAASNAASDGDVPLPLPPPPEPVPAPTGQNGSGQQGSLDTVPAPQVAADAKSDPAPAADTSQAADTSLNDVIAPVPGEAKGLAQDAGAEPPVSSSDLSSTQVPAPTANSDSTPPTDTPQPGTPSTSQIASSAPDATPTIETLSKEASNEQSTSASTLTESSTSPKLAEPSTDTISDTNADAPPAKVVDNKPGAVTKKPAVPAKLQKPAQRTASPKPSTLGSKPVVLVPSETDSAIASSGNVLYGEAPASAQTTPVQKKRTLLDLLNKKTDQPATTVNDQVASIAVPQKQPTTIVNAKPQPNVDAAPQQVSPALGGFVAQLASYRSPDEANQEYARIRTKHPAAVSGLSPVVTKVVVAGSTRYRLAVGPTGSRADADRVCSQLLAEGERDCIVKSR